MTVDEKDQDRKTFDAVLDEREIVFNMPTEGQLIQLMRFVGAAQRASADGSTIIAAARILDVLLAMIADPVDREFVDTGMIEGRINLTDMFDPLESIIENNKEAAPKNGPVKAARGRR